MSKSITKEQQEKINAFAKAVYNAQCASEDKKELNKTSEMKQALITAREALDKGMAVSFTLDDHKTVVKGTLKTKYTLNWEFIEA